MTAGWKAIGRGDGGAPPPCSPMRWPCVLAIRSCCSARRPPRSCRDASKDATATLQQALEIDPRFVDASRLLGAIAYSKGDLALAIATYEKALKHAPEDARLAADLIEWRRGSRRASRLRRAPLRSVQRHVPGARRRALASDATRHLDAAFWRIGQKLGVYPANPVVVMLYTEKQFRDITRAPEWSNGQYDGRIRIPVAGATASPTPSRGSWRTSSRMPWCRAWRRRGVPAWLHEGMAQYFAGDDLQGARRRVKARGTPVPLKRLERGFGELNAADAAAAYDQSLAAVGLLFERADFGWSRLLGDLAGGEPFERAIERFGFSYADLEAALAR